MTDPTPPHHELPPVEPPAVEPPPTPEQREEAAAIRRRWITLGEILAVAAVVISGLTFWNSYDSRREEQAERTAEKREAAKEAAQKASRIGLTVTEAGGERLAFKGAACTLQSSDITFPAALNVSTQSTVLEHRIDGEPLSEPVIALAKAAGNLKQGRVPMLIESQCEDDGGVRSEKAIYDLAWSIDERFLLGRSLKLDGLIRRETVKGDGKARLDALWEQARPKPKVPAQG